MSLDMHAARVLHEPNPASAADRGDARRRAPGQNPAPHSGVEGAPHQAGGPHLASVGDPPVALRPRIRSVTVSIDSGRHRVQVDIERGADRALGLTEGPLVASAARRLVADAALGALALLAVGAERAAVDAVVVSPLGSERVALVTVVLDAGSHEEVHVGAAVVRNTGEHDAIARAVLDATNRRLSARV